MPYRKTLMDVLGPSAADVYRAVAWSIPVTILAGGVALVEFWSRGLLVAGLAALGAMAAMFAFVAGGALLLSRGAGSAAEGVLQHRGSSTPGEAEYSYEQALVMRGEVAKAIHAFERRIAEAPDLVAPYLLAAELHVREGNTARAEALYRTVREIPAAREAELVRAANGLIDLYLGPLQRRGLARRELLYLIDTFPTSQSAAHARTALERLGRPGTADGESQGG